MERSTLLILSAQTLNMSQTHTVVDMESLFQSAPMPSLPEAGQLVEGTVILIDKKAIVVELDNQYTGMISGREMRDALSTAASLSVGDRVTACVLEPENDEGMVVLSLRRASQEKTWKFFLDAFEKDETIAVVPKEANKGGLLLDMDGIKGFIPVSQLAPLNYPRVNGADSAKILARLQQLVGQKFTVKIISIDKENGKLILSEKAAFAEERNQALTGLQVGDIVEGEVSGIVKFGIFVAFGGLEGLVHISEIAWGHVHNAHDFAKRGDRVQVKIIGIDGDKISLSMKQLTKDPWEEVEKKYKVGSTVETTIARLAQFGAFVQLTDDIHGLIHNSEIPGNPSDPADALKVGEKVKARVIEINKDEKRVGLTLLPEGESPREKAMQEGHSESDEAYDEEA